MSMEQRRARRVKDELTLTVSYFTNAGENKILHILSRDISSTGVRVRTPDFVPVGTKLKIEAALEQPRRAVTVVGVVRWIHEASGVAMYEAGIEFENLTPEATALLDEYVRQKNKNEQG